MATAELVANAMQLPKADLSNSWAGWPTVEIRVHHAIQTQNSNWSLECLRTLILVRYVVRMAEGHACT
jgi:hypothetical protein